MDRVRGWLVFDLYIQYSGLNLTNTPNSILFCLNGLAGFGA
jgi:hypothetical protein